MILSLYTFVLSVGGKPNVEKIYISWKLTKSDLRPNCSLNDISSQPMSNQEP